MSRRSPSSTSSSETRTGADVPKLLGRIALLGALVLGSMAFFFWGPLPYKHQLAMLIDKRVMLDATPAPRVILVGGSNLMFGVDSAVLEQSLGIPVVNMGVFGGLGLLAPLDVILPHVRPGDTVVLVPEYEMLFTGLAPFDKNYYRWFLAVDPRAAWHFYYSRQRPQVFLADFLMLMRDKLGALFVIPFKGNHSLAGDGYIRYEQVVNRFGDGSEEIRPAPPDQLAGRNNMYRADAFKPELVDQLNAVTARFESRGARVLLTFGVFPDGEYTLNQKVIDATAGQLRDDGTFQVVGHPRDFLYPYSDFSDSVNHLRPGARTLRTERLAELLAAAGVGARAPAAAKPAAPGAAR
jgi:hypothetical protein